MRWDKENIGVLRSMLRRCDEISKQIDEAEISGTDAAKLMMDFESETTWAASTVFAFAADVLRAFDLMDDRRWMLDYFEYSQAWYISDGMGKVITNFFGSPLEALLAAAELVTKDTEHGD